MTTEEQAAFLRLIDKLRVFVEKEAKRPTVFKPGQLVRRTRWTSGGPPIGCIGVVRHIIMGAGSSIGVEWSNPKVGAWSAHDLNHALKSTSGWYVPPADLELCNPGEA